MSSRWVAVWVAAAAVAGCTADAIKEQVATVEPGMGPVEVSARLGAPEVLHRDGDREAWQYCRQGVVADDYVIAWFRADRLVATTIDDDLPMTSCASRFEEFSWDDAPATDS